MTSSNLLLRELVQQKRKSTSSDPTDSPAKREKRDSVESSRAVENASEKAKITTSHEVHDSASDEAHDSTSDEAHHTLQCGPPVSGKLSKLVNDKFQTEYSVEKRKELLKKVQNTQ